MDRPSVVYIFCYCRYVRLHAKKDCLIEKTFLFCSVCPIFSNVFINNIKAKSSDVVKKINK